jgi:hypothetical protein
MYFILSYLEKFLPIAVLVITSLSIRFILQIIGQRWIMTASHTYTVFLLPIITFIITKVISGNIALSLGMIGALSIVRFRHPVRSPLELSIYFLLITMGIAASVDLKWFVFLIFSIIFSGFVIYFINLLSNKFQKPFFLNSFSEGNSLSTLEVTTLIEFQLLDESIFLKQKNKTENNINYVLYSNNYVNLLDLEKVIKNNKNVITYQFTR